MRLNWTDFGRKCQLPWLMAFGTLPVGLIYCANVLDGRWEGVLALAVLYGLLATLCLPVRGRMRLVLGMVGAAVLLGTGFVLMRVREHGSAMLIPVLYAALLLLGLPVSSWERGHELPPAAGTICLVAHVIAQVLVNADRRQFYANDIRVLLTLSFVGYAALMLLWMNRVSLNEAVSGRDTVPTAMRRKNVLLTMGVLAVTLLISAVPAIVRAVQRLWDALMICIGTMMRWLGRLLAVEETVGGTEGGGAGGVGGLSAAEPGWLAFFLQKVFMVVAAILAAAAVVFALRVLWRKLKWLLALLAQRLREYVAVATEDYEDEVTDTREKGERSRMALRRRPSMHRADERRMNPAERIRYRYRLLQARHAEWLPSSTARENLPDETASIYERARYSGHATTAQDAERFAEQTRR